MYQNIKKYISGYKSRSHMHLKRVVGRVIVTIHHVFSIIIWNNGEVSSVIGMGNVKIFHLILTSINTLYMRGWT